MKNTNKFHRGGGVLRLVVSALYRAFFGGVLYV